MILARTRTGMGLRDYLRRVRPLRKTKGPTKNHELGPRASAFVFWHSAKRQLAPLEGLTQRHCVLLTDENTTSDARRPAGERLPRAPSASSSL